MPIRVRLALLAALGALALSSFGAVLFVDQLRGHLHTSVDSSLRVRADGTSVPPGVPTAESGGVDLAEARLADVRERILVEHRHFMAGGERRLGNCRADAPRAHDQHEHAPETSRCAASRKRMRGTPAAQLVVAEATNWTLGLTVLLFTGAVTCTEPPD